MSDRARAALHTLLLWLFLALLSATSACAIVPQNRRQYLADPTMPAQDDALERRAARKFHTIREGAAGADGKPAGGGCGCGN
ncbi:MAG TPA: DUF4266 domain-containing protein [Polyangiaceae bacterium]